MANGGKERCDGPDTAVKSPVVSLKMQDPDHTLFIRGDGSAASGLLKSGKRGLYPLEIVRSLSWTNFAPA